MPFDNPFGNVIAANGKNTVFAGLNDVWNLVSADGKTMLKANVGDTLSLLTPNRFGFGRDGKIGIMDAEGNEVQPATFDDAYAGGDGEFIVYRVGDQLGILTATGLKITDARFDVVRSSGSAAERGMLIAASGSDGRNWIIDLNTHEVQPADFDLPLTMIDGHLVVRGVKSSGVGLADRKGKLVIDHKYVSLGDPSGGLISFQEDYASPCGYLDYEGKVVIEPKFSQCLPFGQKDALAKELSTEGRIGKFGPIDRSGEWLAPPSYDYAALPALSEYGFSRLEKGFLSIGKRTGEQGLYSTDEGKEIVPMTHRLFRVISADWFIFSEMSSPMITIPYGDTRDFQPAIGVMDKHGKRLIEPSSSVLIHLDASGKFFQTSTGLSLKSKAGLHDLNGKSIVPQEWTRLKVDLDAGVIKGYEVEAQGVERIEHLRALYDLEGKPLLKIRTTACGAHQVLNGAGKPIWPKNHRNYCPKH